MFKIERLISNSIVLLFLCSCAAMSNCTGISNEAKVDAAKTELMAVRSGLIKYRAENDSSAYPHTAQLSSYRDLFNALSPYIEMPEGKNATWTFISYTSVKPDTFVLRARAKDRNRTYLTVTSITLSP